MEKHGYLDFELRIEKKGRRYQATVVHSPAGEASYTFSRPVSDLELENFILRMENLRMESTRRDTRRIRTPEMELARQFGRKLFKAVFRADIRACFISSQNEAKRRGLGLRLKLRLEAPKLINIPWEYLYDASLGKFLSLFENTPIVRYIEMPEPALPLTVKLPLSVLIMVSSPTDYPPLDTEREQANLREALGELASEGMVTMTWVEEATLPALSDCLLRGRFHIFHYIGHGGFDERSQDGVLALEGERGRSQWASGERLAYLLGNHPTLRLVILNSCEGARTSCDDPFAGTAMTLVRTGGVPAVVAMQFAITDEAAIIFVRGFYNALSVGRPVDAAVTQGRLAIFTAGNDVEWGTPVLYMRAPDGRIFDVKSLTPEERAARHRAAEAARRESEAAERRALEQRRAQLASLYEQATARLAEQDWAGGCELLAQIQEMEPDYRDVAGLLKQAQAEQARAEQVAALLAQGDEHLGRSEWSQAAKAYRQALALVPDHPKAVARLAEAERQLQVTTLYTAAQGHLAAGCWSKAIEGFRAVLELDSTHDEAARQLAEAQSQLEREEAEERARREQETRQAELARLYGAADEAAQAGDWSKAIESFQAVVRLDASYRDASARLAQAQEALVAEEAARQREAQLAGLYEKATDRIQARDWPEAVRLLREIRLVDTSFRDVDALLAQVASEREREKQLTTLCDRAEGHFRKGEWAQAVELYGQVLALEPGYRDAAAKRAEAQRQQQLADQYAQALEHLQAQRWPEAIEGFEAVIEIDPYYGDPTYGNAATLLARAQQEKERADLPPPPAVKPPRPTALPEEITRRGKPTAQQQKEMEELPPPPAARPRRPTALPEEIKPRGKPRDRPR